jgi:hypothetical protein
MVIHRRDEPCMIAPSMLGGRRAVRQEDVRGGNSRDLVLA